ncbi:hypothetical protein ACMU_10515 [Actibacterium mucosum KCTC 23349]|uniref:Uncharacterized protein n=1 Tax=Actibacterium mucosum KCTC 23349 TaxID=1454373 RepID=A0A037ZMV7_9RHOB|nr:hypothetical protein [Actibacterium mucosum]KAJ56176.1 hypothetical protein ACMU_10515 [Actibacterium mucosum KCTC 23349]
MAQDDIEGTADRDGVVGIERSPFGLPREQLADWLSHDPEGLARMAADVIRQGGATPMPQFQTARGGLKGLSDQLLGILIDRLQTPLTQILDIESGNFVTLDNEDKLLGWFERIFGPFYPTGKVIEKRHYAPVFDLRLGFNVDQTIKAAVTYKTEDKRSGSIVFKADGVASTLKFWRNVTVDDNFPAIPGDQQVALPVLMRFREYENHYQPTDKRYSATVLRVYEPIQSRPTDPYFTPINDVNWGNTGHPIGSGASKLNKTQTVVEGVSLENKLTLDLGDERSVEMTYTAEQNSTLAITLTSERSGHFWQEFGNNSEMIRRIDQVDDDKEETS